MERSDFGKKSFYLQYDSFQIGNETAFLTMNGNGKGWFLCLSETNHDVNENFSSLKRIVLSQKNKFVALSF